VNSRHLILIALTGAGLVVFAPMSKDTEPARTAQIAEKQPATPAPVQEIEVIPPKVKVVLPPGLDLDGNGTRQPISKRKVRRLVIEE
jgi:hypothetical protein